MRSPPPGELRDRVTRPSRAPDSAEQVVTTEHARPFAGVHCETVATGTLLASLGCNLSEPTLFGLGEALGFVFLNLSSLPLPFLGGRSKPFELTQAACRNLGVACLAEETTSKAKAWTRLEAQLRSSRPVGLQLDCYYLPYFTQAPHFAGHFVAATRLVGEEVEVVDTVQQGTVQRVSRRDLEAARHARGPMSARARAYTLQGRPTAALGGAALRAMRNNARRYLTPDFSGMGACGIEKLAKSLPRWLDGPGSRSDALRLAANLMERAGTGGALFRNLYRDFLDEAASLLPAKAERIRTARDAFARSANMWTGIARLVDRCAADGRAAHLVEASALCRPIVESEVSAMQALAQL